MIKESLIDFNRQNDFQCLMHCIRALCNAKLLPSRRSALSNPNHRRNRIHFVCSFQPEALTPMQLRPDHCGSNRNCPYFPFKKMFEWSVTCLEDAALSLPEGVKPTPLPASLTRPKIPEQAPGQKVYSMLQYTSCQIERTEG
jgi:hypothetical protein